MLVASAIEKLVSEDEGSFDHASSIIEALEDLKPTGSSLTIKGTSSGNLTEGLTEHSSISFDDKDEEFIKEYGIFKERTGKWIITKSVDKESFFSQKKITVLWIHHFLYQDTGSESHRRYFLEYGTDLSPVSFGYIGEPEIWFSIGHFSIYLRPPIVLLGKTRMPKEGLVISYDKPD